MLETNNNRGVPGPQETKTNTNDSVQAMKPKPESTKQQKTFNMLPTDVPEAFLDQIPHDFLAQELAKSASAAGDVRDLVAEAAGKQESPSAKKINKAMAVNAREFDRDLAQVLGADTEQIAQLAEQKSRINIREAGDQVTSLSWQGPASVLAPPLMAIIYAFKKPSKHLNAAIDFAKKVKAIQIPKLDQFLKSEKLTQKVIDMANLNLAVKESSAEDKVLNLIASRLLRTSPKLKQIAQDPELVGQDLHKAVSENISSLLADKAKSINENIKEVLISNVLDKNLPTFLAGPTKKLLRYADQAKGLGASIGLKAQNFVNQILGKLNADPLNGFVKSSIEFGEKTKQESVQKTAEFVANEFNKNKDGIFSQIQDLGASVFESINKATADIVKPFKDGVDAKTVQKLIEPFTKSAFGV